MLKKFNHQRILSFNIGNCERTALLLALSLALVLLSASPVLAHGTEFEYQAKTSYEIVSSYSDGAPMAGAQVLVYAPSDPAQPWVTGTTDENGRYVLTPDTSIAGQWAIQVRQAGHGGMLNIAIGTGPEAAAAGGTGFSPAQLAVMIIAVLWGFTGTALYFKKERS